MGKTLRLLFNLHPGEGWRAGLFILLCLFWSIGSYGTLILSEGMFLEHLGADALPRAYLFIALFLCTLSGFLIYALEHISIKFLLLLLIGAASIAIFAFFVFYPAGKHTAVYWYLFKIFGGIVPISIYTVYWAFADQYYDLQDGKRFFAFFNSITFLGDALGGGMVSQLLHLIGERGLMLLFSLTILAALPFVLLISKRISPISEEHSEPPPQGSPPTLATILQTILFSRFTLYLIGFYFLMQLLCIVTEFNYMEALDKTFFAKPGHSLTAFLGRVGMWISLGNMLFGMFIYSRLVKKLGINNIVLIAPLFFLSLLSVWMCKETLPIVIFAIIAREGMTYSFDDNNLNLLLAGVPNQVKNQVRIGIESFIEPIGMLAAATLLFCLHSHALPLGIVIALVALGLVFFLRKAYPGAIFQNLIAHAIHFEKRAIDHLKQLTLKEKRKSECSLLSELKAPNERQQLLAFEYLLLVGHPRVLPALLNHIGKLSLPGKLKAIDLLSESSWAKEVVVLEKLNHWYRILPHPALKSSIHFYLARHGILRPERVMHDLHSDHIGLRAAAILTLKTAPNGFQFPSFSTLANTQLEELLASDEEAHICLGLKIIGFEKNPSSITLVLPYLKHSVASVQRDAAKALSLVAHPDYHIFAPQLISQLKHIREAEVRIDCLKAIEKLADSKSVRALLLESSALRPLEHTYVERSILKLGSSQKMVLLAVAEDWRIHSRARLLAAKILDKLDRSTLQRRLYSIVRAEIKRAYFYFYHSTTVQKQLPEYDLTILQTSLKTNFQESIDLMIQLLGVGGSLESEILSRTLRSPNRKIRAQALESLEKTCDGRLFHLLEPLINEQKPEAKLRTFLRTGGIPLNLNQLLDYLLDSPSRTDQIIALTMKARLQTPDWRLTLKKILASEEAIFSQLAHELLETETP